MTTHSGPEVGRAAASVGEDGSDLAEVVRAEDAGRHDKRNDRAVLIWPLAWCRQHAGRCSALVRTGRRGGPIDL
jgi:hypothetical protein